MTPEEFKNIMFNRVLAGGERFNMRHDFNDIICFTIVNPWSNVLHKISKMLEQHRVHLFRDELRIKEKKIIDGKIISLYGYTEFGSVYEIKLIPSLLDQWANFARKNAYRNPEGVQALYVKMLNSQKAVDQGSIII
jgi:hypothetical protein